jgi:hypothetical protein
LSISSIIRSFSYRLAFRLSTFLDLTSNSFTLSSTESNYFFRATIRGYNCFFVAIETVYNSVSIILIYIVYNITHFLQESSDLDKSSFSPLFIVCFIYSIVYLNSYSFDKNSSLTLSNII